jgi:hypothetical protein
MTTMEALGTSPYPLTIDGRVDLLEVGPGSRGSILLPLAVDSACGTITGGSACGTITGGSACGTITGSSACGTITGGVTNLDRVSSRAKQLFPIVLEVSLIISTQAGHSVVVVDGVTLVLIAG